MKDYIINFWKELTTSERFNLIGGTFMVVSIVIAFFYLIIAMWTATWSWPLIGTLALFFIAGAFIIGVFGSMFD